MKKAIVLVANGTEEIEAVVAIDVLRRATVHVLVLSLDSLLVTCARATKLQADSLLKDHSNKDLMEFDCLVLPGGLKGAESFASSSRVLELLQLFTRANKIVGSICAGSMG